MQLAIDFDESRFDRQLSVLSVKTGFKYCQTVMDAFRESSQHFSHTDLPNFPYLIKEAQCARVLLAESIKGAELLTEKQRELIAATESTLEIHNFTVGFKHMSPEAVLRDALPKDIGDITTKFETVGHIAHMNIQSHSNNHRFSIGHVILQKNKHMGIRTVVNKTGNIENKFRVLPMEVIAGIDDMMVELEESGCKFRFDFRDVFWNSRLENEHRRIIQRIKPGEVVCDMFAGVGPFAIPLARKGAIVYANDLNPACYKYLVENADSNLVKRKRANLKPYNLDGIEFLRQVVENECIGRSPDGTFKVVRKLDHVLMNLPMTAVEFLSSFKTAFPPGFPLPTVHCYCFVTGPENSQEILDNTVALVEKHLGCPLRSENTVIRKIRQTAGGTTEFCVEFQLPTGIYQ